MEHDLLHYLIFVNCRKIILVHKMSLVTKFICLTKNILSTLSGFMNLGTPNMHSKNQLPTISLKFILEIFMTTRGASICNVYFRMYNCSLYKCHFFLFLLFSLLNLYIVRIWQIYCNFLQLCGLSA